MTEFVTIATAAVALLVWVVLSGMWRPRKVMSLQDKHAFVTGAASGIGRGLAIALSNAGAVVTLVDVNKGGMEETARVINQPGRVHVCQCDVSDYKQVESAVAIAVATFKRPVDVLINNAGIVSGKKFIELTLPDMERTIQVNTLAQFYTTKVTLPAMIEHRQGLLVTVSSMMGLIGASSLVDYCASKFALVGFHEALRLELRDTGIRTLLVCPMAVDTGMFNGYQDGKTLWQRFVTRYLLPMLSVDQVVGTIMDAIVDGRHDELISCAPGWRQHVLPWVARGVRLFPVWVMEIILGLGGAIHGMDSFVGRAKVE
ncbi:hypothetical protein H310_00663 [Aphanomyces invadans]|uniref:Ketoreductase domain-containing protein n=1 Tax=Aphanomyces invadans TaxID=157072 RepID=A0A024UVF7_9STRA|nr:hypothetical protein H310_00663 [Aphanomyces invadans]ETW10339.1 hypothetical protein H310_00663 [Aphanomyces invadans]|eukprot:XP_008861750.1 hypothetical protein H310_00663 [Aphanomyces invadans]